ncbi:hypothetical protein ACOME3_007860 [Neoechinorhynchus agilis]
MLFHFLLRLTFVCVQIESQIDYRSLIVACPRPWQFSADFICFLPVKRSATFADAWKSCSEQGGNLFEFEEDEPLSLLMEIIETSIIYMKIRTIRSTPIDFWIHFSNVEMVDSEGKHRCSAVSSKSYKGFNLSFVPCESEIPFICRRRLPLVKDCPQPPWTFSMGICYMFLTDELVPLSDHALTACARSRQREQIEKLQSKELVFEHEVLNAAFGYRHTYKPQFRYSGQTPLISFGLPHHHHTDIILNNTCSQLSHESCELPGWVAHAGSCYTVSVEPLVYNAAKEFCGNNTFFHSIPLLQLNQLISEQIFKLRTLINRLSSTATYSGLQSNQIWLLGLVQYHFSSRHAWTIQIPALINNMSAVTKWMNARTRMNNYGERLFRGHQQCAILNVDAFTSRPIESANCFDKFHAICELSVNAYVNEGIDPQDVEIAPISPLVNLYDETDTYRDFNYEASTQNVTGPHVNEEKLIERYTPSEVSHYVVDDDLGPNLTVSTIYPIGTRSVHICIGLSTHHD